MGKKAKKTGSDVMIGGFFRIKIGEDKEGKTTIVGDSGWNKNNVTDLGIQNFIIGCFATAAGSITPSHLALATGTDEPAVDATALTGEASIRKALDSSVIASVTYQATAEWTSTDQVASDLGSIGIFGTSAAGTMMAGNTFATSSWGANQAVSATYQLRFTNS